MDIRIVEKESYRTLDRKINQDDNKLRLVIDMDINEFGRFKKVLYDGDVEILYGAFYGND